MLQRNFGRAVVILLATVCLMAFAPIGCGDDGATATTRPADGSGGGKRLYWVQALKGHPVHQMTQIGFSAKARELGYEPVIVGTDAPDIAGTIALAEQALASGQEVGMAIWTGNPAYNGLFARAASQNIPVILPHFPVTQAEAPGATGVIACDPAAYAATCAEKIGAKIEGKGAVAITQGSFNTTENLVAATFRKTMGQKYPNVKVLDPIEEGFDPAAGSAKAVALIRANPDLAAAFSTTGGGPLTWSSAQRDAGRKLVVVGMDYTRVNLDLVKNGDVYAVIGQPLWEESNGAAELLDKAIKGEQIPWWTKLQAPFITKDDLGPYYELIDKVEAQIKK
jgi:ribose transport system substrate-binding protein